MDTGVYTITNTLNGKMYVGSSSASIKKRWSTHISTLNSNTHHNQHLQHAWNKYGKEVFIFEILVTSLPEYCLSEEQYWLNILNTKILGYNIATQTSSNFKGIKHKQASKNKIREAALNQWKTRVVTDKMRKYLSDKALIENKDHLHTPEVHAKISKAAKIRNAKLKAADLYISPRKATGKYGVCKQLDLNCNIIKVHNSLYDVFPLFNLPNASHIIRASNSTRTCCGFKWIVYTKTGEIVTGSV